ncbi:hypothetical protein NQU17_02600 [Clostridiaceae bacterium HFYG-1003]|nr:hypothetical protein NQU17_02600 [Clostridiaceae bacterium HFYG-1003]
MIIAWLAWSETGSLSIFGGMMIVNIITRCVMRLSELKFIEEASCKTFAPGVGEGRIYTTEYECPCGKGRVVYEDDQTPGYKESAILIYCATCREKYEPDYSVPYLALKEK